MPETNPTRTTADPGSISTGTLRPEDLIPTFISALDTLREERSFNPDADSSRHGREDDALGRLEERTLIPGYYYDPEQCQWDLETLFDYLEEFSPPGHYFGAHPGDGADFGFWPDEDEPEEVPA